MSPGESADLERELERARREIKALKSRIAEQEEGLVASEEMLRFREAVIENAAEGVCVCQDLPEFPFVRFTVWNRRMVEITGYEMDEINRLGWYQTMYPDPEVQRRARQRMERMREGNNLRFERWVVRCADGTERPLAISTSVLVTQEGSVHVLAMMQDLSPQESLREETRRAITDELTAVRNRRGFLEGAYMVIEFARRQRQAVTLGLIDVNGFKILNDTRGHAEGDRALKEIGLSLQASVGPLDVVGRLGGDEFALVLPDMEAPRAKAFFEELIHRLSELRKRSEWPIGFSAGVVTYSSEVPSVSDAMARADRLMYVAKQSGATCVECEEVSSEESEPQHHEAPVESP